MYIEGNETLALSLREVAVMYVYDHFESFEAYIDFPESMATSSMAVKREFYASKMRQVGTWASNLVEGEALATALQVGIKFWQNKQVVHTSGRGNAICINLNFVNRNHFNLLMPVEMLNGSLLLQQYRSVIKQRMFCLPVSKFRSDVPQTMVCGKIQSESMHGKTYKRESKPKRTEIRNEKVELITKEYKKPRVGTLPADNILKQIALNSNRSLYESESSDEDSVCDPLESKTEAISSEFLLGYTCCFCDQVFFKTGVTKTPIDTQISAGSLTSSIDGCYYTCWTCYNNNSQERVSMFAAINKAYSKLHNMPHLKLNRLEERLCALRNPYVMLMQLPKGGEFSIKGSIINVPCDIDRVVSTLPACVNSKHTTICTLEEKTIFKKRCAL